MQGISEPFPGNVKQMRAASEVFGGISIMFFRGANNSKDTKKV
jgi:hypothetical protein